MTIQTDSFGALILFARGKNQELEGFHNDEIESLLLPISIYPGRRKIFTATVVHSDNKQEFRRCSSKERQCLGGRGLLRRQRQVEKLKAQRGVKAIEINIPTAKDLDPERME